MNNLNACLASIGVAVPPFSITQSQAEKFIETQYTDKLHSRSRHIFHQILQHPSIQKRHIAVDSNNGLSVLKDEDPDKRMQRFTHWSRLLGGEAIRTALLKAQLTKEDVTTLIVNTCTGYICPGISTYLIEDLELSRNVKAYDLVGSGCGGALPNLQLAAQSSLTHSGGIALAVSIEICSATFQMDNDMSLIISNSIFGDGAAAAIVWDRPCGIELVFSDQIFLPEFRNDVRYIYKSGVLHNQLSKKLPQLIGENIKSFINKMLTTNGLSQGDIDHYCIHPGGDKILEACAGALSLDQKAMKVSRDILSEYGNLSSPSVLFELERIFDGVEKGQWCLMLAFGAGLSIYGWLLRGI